MAASTVDAVLKVPTDRTINFFRLWLEFLAPYHDLTEREIDLMSYFLHKRQALSADILNEEILDSVLMSDDSKKEISKLLGITDKNFNIIYSRLRKKKLIINERINKRFIPVLKKSAKTFQMLIYFEFADE
jgi:hypothetical protein